MDYQKVVEEQINVLVEMQGSIKMVSPTGNLLVDYTDKKISIAESIAHIAMRLHNLKEPERFGD